MHLNMLWFSLFSKVERINKFSIEFQLLKILNIFLKTSFIFLKKNTQEYNDDYITISRKTFNDSFDEF